MNTKLINSFGWEPSISLKKGLADTIEWYKKEGYKGYQRYNSFKENKINENSNLWCDWFYWAKSS